MKTFLKWALIVVGVIIAIVVIGGFLIPQQWTVTRSITINAPSEVIYPEVANLKNWQKWSPWTKDMDKTIVYTYEGPEMGVGAKWLWISDNVGKGYLEIHKADPRQGITYELFIDINDMTSTMTGIMDFNENDRQTEVVWTDHGNSGNNLVKRWMSLMIRKILGDEFENGLNKLKALVEQK